MSDSTKAIIYGFDVSENSCFEAALSVINADNRIFKRSQFDETSFRLATDSLADCFDKDPSSVSLAILGLADYAIKKQLNLTERELQLFYRAKESDPLKKYTERHEHVASLERRLISFIKEQRVNRNVIFA